MASPILLPRQGQSVESCIISKFLVAVGDKVSVGTPLFSYETDKASFEEEAKAEGVILALFFKEGDEVPVLTNVGVIGEEGESIEEFVPEKAEQEESTGSQKEPMDEVTGEAPGQHHKISYRPEPSREMPISPRAKRLAETEAINYRLLRGSGPGGRIIEEDIKALMAKQGKTTPLARTRMREEGLVPGDRGTGPALRIRSHDLITSDAAVPGDSEIVELTRIRKLIAGAMHRSLQNSAQLTHHLSADAGRILALRKRLKKNEKQKNYVNITLNDMICFGAIRTLKKFPRVNAHFLGNSLRIFKGVHLGLAVDTERGLMVPVVRNADGLSIQELSLKMKAMADACRSGSIDPELLQAEGASFSVSNLGNYGVEMFTPVVNLPQVAILGVNTIVPRPKDQGDGRYKILPYLGLSLTYDHQALDGGEATRFLRALADEIENFETDISE